MSRKNISHRSRKNNPKKRSVIFHIIILIFFLTLIIYMNISKVIEPVKETPVPTRTKITFPKAKATSDDNYRSFRYAIKIINFENIEHGKNIPKDIEKLCDGIVEYRTDIGNCLKKKQNKSRNICFKFYKTILDIALKYDYKQQDPNKSDEFICFVSDKMMEKYNYAFFQRSDLYLDMEREIISPQKTNFKIKDFILGKIHAIHKISIENEIFYIYYINKSITVCPNIQDAFVIDNKMFFFEDVAEKKYASLPERIRKKYSYKQYFLSVYYHEIQHIIDKTILKKDHIKNKTLFECRALLRIYATPNLPIGLCHYEAYLFNYSDDVYKKALNIFLDCMEVNDISQLEKMSDKEVRQKAKKALIDSENLFR